MTGGGSEARLSYTDQMRIRSAERATALSPDGTAYECQQCYGIFPSPVDHYAIGMVVCPSGAAGCKPFVAPVPTAAPPPSVPVFVPAPREKRARRVR